MTPCGAEQSCGGGAAKGIVNLLNTHTVWQRCGIIILPTTPPYKNHRFPLKIISHVVWLYFRFCLSFHEVEELLYERGIMVTYEPVIMLGLATPDKKRQPRATLVVQQIWSAVYQSAPSPPSAAGGYSSTSMKCF
jgi:hypothetical protein